jgi:hypothetical protein
MNEEPKLPRKLKKGYNYVFFTKHQLLDRLELVSATMTKYKSEGKSDSWLRTFQMEIDYIQERLKHPYPVTKWTRKAEHLPDVAHYIQWRKEN